ncbi:hypothetical protein M0Q50_03590 [bacterium]|jgi:hypothetical protein|nr:hypothetical protein [bacterium]
MKILKKEDDRKVRISISISPYINVLLRNNTRNKSHYIELALLEYYKKCGLDISKIKL